MSQDPQFRLTVLATPAQAPCAVPEGDDKERSVCKSCGFIDYRNPKIVVGCVIADAKGRVLLGRRAIEPRRGKWGIPGGFMECKESLEEGALFCGVCFGVEPRLYPAIT